MNAFEAELTKTMIRMERGMLYDFQQAANQPGNTVREVRFYANGPLCLEVLNPEGGHIASIQKTIAQQAR